MPCVDARLRDERVFSIASAGENADTESIPSKTIVLCQKTDHKMAFPLQTEFLQFAPAGRRIREGFASLEQVGP